MNNENNNLNGNGFNEGNNIGNINPNPNNMGIENLGSIPNNTPNPNVSPNMGMPLDNQVNNQSAGVNTNGTFFNASSLGSVDNTPNPNSNLNPTPNLNVNNQNNFGTPEGFGQPLNNMNTNNNNMGTPNYTNPQNINPNPMPGFENPNAIGEMPPISFEPEKPPKKKVNKTLFVVIIIVVLFMVGFGVYYVLKYTDLLNNSNAQVTVNAKDLEFNLGDTLPTEINEYATISGTDTKNCSIDMLNVDVSKPGTYEYTVSCGETKGTGRITIKDTSTTKYETKDVYVGINEEVKPSDFIKGDTTNLTVNFVDETVVKNNLTKAGTYELTIKVADENKKEATVKGRLVVLEHNIAGYVECSKNVKNEENQKMTISLVERFGIFNTSTFDFSGITIEENHFIIDSEEIYADLKAKYQTEKKLTINKITSSNVEFDDNNKEIIFKENRDKADVINEYGNDNMKNYGTIMNYFKGNGYTCKYVTK